MAMKIVEFLLVCLPVPEKNRLLFSKSSSLMFHMVLQEGGEIWMENYRVGEAESLNRTLPGGAQSAITPASVKFFDQEAAAYFGELEEDLVQGVEYMRETEDRKSLFWRRPPTLEIFPSWPMRGSLQSARSTDAGSAQNKESHLEMESQSLGRTCSDGSADHQLSNLEDKGKMTNSSARKDGRVLDAKTMRRLALNREAAKKSRLRKKAYVQQLELSRIKLQQIEQELERARSQGLFLAVAAGSSNEATDSVPGTAAAAFDVEYGRWQEEECRRMGELRAAVQARLPDASLGVMLDEWVAHYDKLFQLKAGVARTDPIHLLNGAWRTPAERCFLWIGGFRPSELLKMVEPVVDPLTEQQVIAMYNLQLSSQQAEEALSLGLHQLQRSLAETVACGGGGAAAVGVDVGVYMSFMGIALGQLASLEGFIRQADKLRQQTLHQLRRNLTIRQATQCVLWIGEYYARLRALSSLWVSRPGENLIGSDSAGSLPKQIT